MILACATATSLAVWIYLALGRGRFWQVSDNLAHEDRTGPTGRNRVAMIVPARNEADVIGAAVSCLLQQDYPLPLDIFVVDDNSSDGTKQAALKAATAKSGPHKLTVVDGKPLPAGWTGKLWALQQGVEHAQAEMPDFLLFTDSDIVHGRHMVSTLVAIAEAGDYSLASFMVKLACASLPEKALIPAFVFFFLQLYPPAWIQSARWQTAGAAGGCLLIRLTSLEAIGGLPSVRAAVIDDCTLAKAVKRSSGKVWLGLTDESVSIRPYGSFAEIGRMISRSAFTQLRHSAALLVTTIAGLFFIYVLPVIALFSRQALAAGIGLGAWLLMATLYWPMIRLYRLRFLWAFALPAVATFYAGATLWSAVQYWRGKGGLWKGRVQDSHTG